MNKLGLYLTLLAVSGCSSLNSYLKINSDKCPDKPPEALASNDVKEIPLNSGTVKESGQLQIGQSKGYVFSIQSTGQKLSYRTKDDICVWVFKPDTKLLNGGELPMSGKYTIQISALKGSTSYDLEMSLGTLASALSPATPSPATTSPTTPSPATPSPATTSPPTTSPPTASTITQDQAIGIVQNWLNAKSQIFGRSYDRGLVSRLTTGPLRIDILKDNGSIDWLQNNGSYYDYTASRIDQVFSFSNSGGLPTLKVSIYENRTLQTPRGIDYSNSGSSNRTYTYYLSQEDGNWKIYDYK